MALGQALRWVLEGVVAAHLWWVSQRGSGRRCSCNLPRCAMPYRVAAWFGVVMTCLFERDLAREKKAERDECWCDLVYCNVGCKH
jgi:hypothetical protein